MRLWDAGGDKPLPWLAAPDRSERGAALLLAHPEVLATQLAALVRAGERAHVRALIPMTERRPMWTQSGGTSRASSRTAGTCGSAP